MTIGSELGYSHTADGQVHWSAQGERTAAPDTYLLHPAPFTALAFAAIQPLLADARRVYAPDYPGCGGSYTLTSAPDIATYATAVGAVAASESATPVDVVGFHSGCLVAVELALRYPSQVRRIVLIDVPAFTTAERSRYNAGLAAPAPLSQDLDSVRELWDWAVTKRAATDGLDASVALFADSLRHGNAWDRTFRAAFAYDVDTRFAELTHATTILATRSGLLEPSRRAAGLIPHATLIERLEIERSVLVENATKIAPDIARVLDAP